MTASPSVETAERVSCIYALLDPDTLQPRYVGKTVVTSELRLKQHIMRAKRDGAETRRDEWIRSLIAAGKLPLIEVLEEGIWSYSEANDREKHWILGLRTLSDDLTNLTVGGQGRSGRSLHVEGRANISAGLRAYHSREDAGAWLRNPSAETLEKRRATFAKPEIRQRSAAIRAEVVNRPGMRELLSAAGKKGCASQRRCADCSYQSTPMTLGRHLKKTGHSGYVELPVQKGDD